MLPKLGKVIVKGKEASVKILNRGKGIKKTIFCYTTDRDVKKALDRKWQSIPADLSGDTISVKLPDGIYQGYFSAYDEPLYTHCCGSSDFITFDGVEK